MDKELLEIKQRLVGCNLIWTDTGREPSARDGGFTIENVLRDVHHTDMLLISGTNGEWRVWHVDAVRDLISHGTHTVEYNQGLTPPVDVHKIIYTLKP